MPDGDLALLERYSESRDAEAFSELVKRYSGMVYGTCLRVTRNPHDAEDAAQNCFVALIQRSESVKSSVAGWLHASATDQARMFLRGQSRRRAREQGAAEQMHLDTQPAWEDVAPFVDEALVELPGDVRVPLILHYLQGRTQAEVAEELGVDQSTISRRLDRGVLDLRDRLRKAGLVTSAAVLVGLLTDNAAVAAPATLLAALGKMALAGIGKGAAGAGAAGGAAAASGTTAATVTGGILATTAGKVAAIAVAGAIAAGGVVTYRQATDGESEGMPATANQVAVQDAASTAVSSPNPVGSGGGPQPVSLEFRLGQDAPGPGLTAAQVEGKDRTVYLRDEVVLSEQDVLAGRVATNSSRREIKVLLTEQGGRKFAGATAEHVREILAILVDGRVISAPMIGEPIHGRRCSIVSSFTEEEAQRIAAGITDPAWASRRAEFGPVIHRFVNDDNEDRNMMLDLDTGQLLTPPDELGNRDRDAMMLWFRQTGADAVGETSADVQGLGCYDMAFRRFPNDQWDSLSARELLDDWDLVYGFSYEEIALSARDGVPRTFRFRTREGALGVLQILEVITAPRPQGVRVQYKVVQGTGSGQGSQIAARSAEQPTVAVDILVVDVPAAEMGNLGVMLTDDWEIARSPNNEAAVKRFASPSSTFCSVLTVEEAGKLEARLRSDEVHAKVLHSISLRTPSGKEATFDARREPIHYMEKTESGLYELKAGRAQGFRMTVTPELAGDMINLTLDPNLVQLGRRALFAEAPDLGVGPPFMQTRSMETSIAVRSGATVAMGGMIEPGDMSLLLLVTARVEDEPETVDLVPHARAVRMELSRNANGSFACRLNGKPVMQESLDGLLGKLAAFRRKEAPFLFLVTLGEAGGQRELRTATALLAKHGLTNAWRMVDQNRGIRLLPRN